MVTQFVMPVVCEICGTRQRDFCYYFFFEDLLTFLGLYHKLHGVHRPVGMKKSTIKRRKRVVPFVPDQNQNIDQSPLSPSASPEASPGISEKGVQSPTLTTGVTSNNRPSRYEPTPIDFTGYQALSTPQRFEFPRRTSPYQPSPGLPPIQTHPPSSGHDHGRKRSFSVVEGTSDLNNRQSTPDTARSITNRLNSISSLLNPTQQSEDTVTSTSKSRTSIPDDTALPSLKNYSYIKNQPLSPTAVPSHTRPLESANDSEKSNRKARLQQEADDLREMLRAKERELQELGNGD
jgi:GATA-binding protein, other eukaryote